MSKKVKTLSTNKKETTITHNTSDNNSIRHSLLSQDLSINIYPKDSLENSIAEYTNNTIEVIKYITKDSLNYPKTFDFKASTIEKIEEYNQNDRIKFSNNIQNMNKSVVTIKTPQNEETAKISYKHIKRIEINPINEEKDKHYWFGAYDKLINSNKLKKIFEFYELDKKPIVYNKLIRLRRLLC
jgi:hypothetical protein